MPRKMTPDELIERAREAVGMYYDNADKMSEGRVFKIVSSWYDGDWNAYVEEAEREG